MITKVYTLQLPDGIHARPATALIRLVKHYKSEVRLQKGERTVLVNSKGDVLKFNIVGDDEAEAAEALDEFFTQINH
jgi:phosphocarrier protein HPr